MAFAPEDGTQAADFARLRAHIAQFAVVTENDPRQDPVGSATSVSLAWSTLRTALLGLAVSRAAVNRLEDFVDRAPTLSYRGTP